MCCFACAVSWATWLLFTGVPAQCFAMRVRCPWRVGSCSPLCPLGVLFCLCGVRGHLAPVHRCARLVRCFACAVSWATWFLFTGVLAWCLVLRVRCPGLLGSCSPVCSLGVLCCGLRVRGVAAGRSLVDPNSGYSQPAGAGYPPGAHSSIQTPAVLSRQGLATLRAHTRPSGRRLFRSRQGLGLLPGEHTSVRTAAGVAWHPVLWFVAYCARSPGLRHPAAVAAWHLSVCLGCGWRRASLACLVAPRGAPRLVRSGRSRCSGHLSRRRVAFPHPFTGWLRGARGGRPRTGLIVPAASPRQGRGAGLDPRCTRSGPRDGVVPGGSLRCWSRAACAAVVGVLGPGH